MNDTLEMESKRLQEQKAEAEQELKQVKSEIRTDKLRSVATDAATTLASGVSSLVFCRWCGLLSQRGQRGRFDLRIDGVSHHSWFRRKKEEFMEALGLPTSRRQNRGLKL